VRAASRGFWWRYLLVVVLAVVRLQLKNRVEHDPHLDQHGMRRVVVFNLGQMAGLVNRDHRRVFTVLHDQPHGCLVYVVAG